MKDFIAACKKIIKEVGDLEEDSSVKLLLWIYLNILNYPYVNKAKKNSYKIAFLEILKSYDGFNELLSVSETIPEDVYEKLEKEILINFTYMSEENKDKELITIKGLESIYENILHVGIRDKTGTYYTPEYIVDYISTNTLKAYLENKIGFKLSLVGNVIMLKELSQQKVLLIYNIIDKIKIIDIACGGGVFLRSALNILFNLKKSLQMNLDIQENDYSIKKRIIEENLYGIDIQSSTITLSRILLLMELSRDEYQQDSLQVHMNIREGNALASDELTSESLYDVIIGNPPYLGERGNKEFFNELKQSYFGNKYYESKMDYFYYFIYRATELLKEGGYLGYITTNYFVTADGATKLRQYIRTHLNFRTIVNFNDLNIFQEARGQHNMIFIASKGPSDAASGEVLCFEKGKYKPDEIEKILLQDDGCLSIKTSSFISQEKLYDAAGQILIQNEGSHGFIIKKLLSNTPTNLGDLCNINQGIVSGADRLTAKLEEKIKVRHSIGSGIFVLTREEAMKKGFFDPVYQGFLKPFYKNSNIEKYRVKEYTQLYILYITDDNLKNIEEYPLILEHLMPYKGILEARREVKNGSISWYTLQWPRKMTIFEGEKILAPQRSLQNIFGYTREDWFASADVYFISSKNYMISLKYILGVLNSSLIYFWLYYRGKRKGDYLEMYTTPLKAIPIGIFNSDAVSSIEELVDSALCNIKEDHPINDIQNDIDKIVFRNYGLNDSEEQEIIDFVKKRRRK